jgi:hypothetical protein
MVATSRMRRSVTFAHGREIATLVRHAQLRLRSRAAAGAYAVRAGIG